MEGEKRKTYTVVVIGIRTILFAERKGRGVGRMGG
jgi:hypothetical protein